MSEAEEADLAADRAVLFHAREERIRPGLDDKILADWNGLMIAALAKAGSVFDRPDWIDLACAGFDFVRDRMMRPDGRLSHAWRDGKAAHPATVDDYANLCRASLALLEATGDARFLEAAEQWLAVLDRHYWDSADGGYFFAADDTTDVITRAKTASDSATPAGNGTMVGVLARLHLVTGNDAYRERAEKVVTTFSGELQRNFFPLGALLNSSDLLARGLQVVIRADRDEAQALLRAVHRVSLPNLVLSVVPASASLPKGHPAEGKEQVGGKPTAYVCEGPVCSLPLTEPEALEEDLRRR
jgi:uncharacterized protein YyaL (SSP411 family)